MQRRFHALVMYSDWIVVVSFEVNGFNVADSAPQIAGHGARCSPRQDRQVVSNALIIIRDVTMCAHKAIVVFRPLNFHFS